MVPGPPGNFCRWFLGPPGWLCWGLLAPPLKWLCRCFLALCVVQRPFARASPVALPSLPGLLLGLRFLPGYPGLAFPCRALPVHPGPVTGASWPPLALPGCPGFAFLAFPCFCQAAKTRQHDGGHPADKFFLRQQRKRTVFDQILAKAFLPAKTWPDEALLLHARLPAKSISLQDVRDSRPGRGPASYPDRPRAFKSCGVSLLSLLFHIKRHAGQLARSLPRAPANIES